MTTNAPDLDLTLIGEPSRVAPTIEEARAVVFAFTQSGRWEPATAWQFIRSFETAVRRDAARGRQDSDR